MSAGVRSPLFLAMSDGLKIFQEREIPAAYAWSAAGGQALHLMDGSYANMQKRTPRCFKGHKQIAHLFDLDATRLISTAKALGVRVVLVEHTGQRGQHVDLCGKPLARAISMAGKAQQLSLL